MYSRQHFPMEQIRQETVLKKHLDKQNGIRRRVGLAFFIIIVLLCCNNSALCKQWMVAVGVIDFADTRIPKLNYCVRDAEVLADYFKESTKDQMDITVLRNEEATKAGVLSSLERIRKSISPDDTVIFYYSSHGIGDENGNTYFITFDSNKDDLANTALPMKQIKAVAEGLGAKNIVMLFDTCHSGGAKSLRQQNEKSFDNIMLAAGKQTRLAMLTSSRTHETSVESPELQHGVFTYHLLQGIQGKADNYPSDGKVSVTELFDYVMVAVPRATDRAQHPTSKFSYNWPGSKKPPVYLSLSGKEIENTATKKEAVQPNTSSKGEQVEAESDWKTVLE